MRRWKIAIVLVVLAFLEAIFIALILAANLPRRSADLDAFTQYQKSPTSENLDRWLKERQKSQDEGNLRKYSGVILALGNAFLIGWIARKQTVAWR